MKQVILSSAILVAMIGQAFAISDPVPKSIVRIFEKQFPGTANYKAFGGTDSYYFSFVADDQVRQSVRYDRRGQLLQTIRYYSESQLDPFIREKVKSRYPNGDIGSVTELVTADRHVYEFAINRADGWSTVRYEPSAGFYGEKSYQRPG